jgi:hypothetical protein
MSPQASYQNTASPEQSTAWWLVHAACSRGWQLAPLHGVPQKPPLHEVPFGHSAL